jgi:maltooligosyltrehalose trehalohydrolase
MSHLPGLADLGVTVIELMPIADFPGNFGWSYDVANQFAPTRLYGTPDDARRFVDEAHRVGIGVILDVVYNHFGRVGEEILRPLSDGYFSTRHQNEWGAAVNFDDENSKPVRDFFKVNVERWIREYHFDGLRIDATQAFEDESSPHILLELARAARQAAPERRVLVVGENEPQRARLFRSGEEGGYEFDALWNDDFRHAAHVRLTGSDEGYCTDYHGSAEEFVAAAKWGFLYQGQRYSWQSNPRGTPALEIAAPRFINYLENHDQVANSLRGARLRELTSPGRLRAMTALLLLAPQTPLLFQGQEFASSVPFLYFNDCSGEEARGVAAGRAKFLSQFPSLATCEAQAQLINPADAAAFERSKLDHRQRVQHGAIYALHRDLLHLRRDDPVFRRCDASLLHGASLGGDALVLRFFDSLGDTRLFVLNFGCQLRLNSIPQPLVAPPENRRWALLWSSEDVRYGGNGTPQVDTPDGWRIPGESALVLEPNPIEASS